MPEFPKTDRNKIRRVANRARYDKEKIYEIIDAARLCHVGLIDEGSPIVIPMVHSRRGNEILLHGSKMSRIMNHIGSGNEICMTFTMVDGLVLARSAFHHSMNYRSVVAFGKGEIIEDESEKRKAFHEFVDFILSGRADDARPPSERELSATTLAAVTMDSASAKVRTGPPNDDKEDLGLDVWAGVVPIRETLATPIPDAQLSTGVEIPAYVNAVLSEARR